MFLIVERLVGSNVDHNILRFKYLIELLRKTLVVKDKRLTNIFEIGHISSLQSYLCGT